MFPRRHDRVRTGVTAASRPSRYALASAGYASGLDALGLRRSSIIALCTSKGNGSRYYNTRYALWNEVKRARAGAKAKHGDDSGEYERFGGTRISERQRRTPAPEASVGL